MDDDRSPGWDVKAITRIANERYGGLKPMFRNLGWEWPGASWLGVANKRIVAEYGSIEGFCRQFGQSSDGRTHIRE